MTSFSSQKYETHLCAGSNVGKKGSRDFHCRMRDSKLTRAFRDREFIVTPIIQGFSPALQCLAVLEKAMREMRGGFSQDGGLARQL